MRKKFFNLLILIAVALCPVYALAQQNNSTAKTDDEAALRQKAYDLLESLAGEIGTMQSPENRARIASNIAGSLWTHNENRARELFAMVQQDINAGLQVPETEDPEDLHTLLVFLRLRVDTINRIAKHDPELAYEFFKATELNPNIKLTEQARTSEHALETYLAKQVAATSPELALQLARKTMSKGYFSDELRKIFNQLNRKHKEQARTLYKDIVQKLGEADLAKDWNARYFAVNFAGTIRPPEIDESNFNELIDVFVRAATDNGCNRKIDQDNERSEACSALSPVISVIAKANPARAKRFENWVSESEYYWQPSPYSELDDAASDGTVEDILSLLGKYPQMDSEIRWRAFLKANSEGDTELARKIASETRDPENKERMLARLDFAKNQAPVDDEKMAEFQNSLSEVKQPEIKVIILASVANQLGEKDRKTAFKLLTQASQMVDAMKPGREQITGQMLLAMVYCYYKSDRGFAIMQALVPKLNEMIEASAKLDGMERRYLRDGEWNMTGEGVLGELLTGLANNASFFAHCDFDRAVSLAGQFERPEVRIMAQLKLAQSILAGPAKPLPFGVPGLYH